MLGNRLLILVGFSLAAATWPIGDSPQEISLAELAVLAGAFAIILAIQCAGLWVASRFTSGWLLDALIAVLVASNAYHFALLTFEASTAVQVTLAIAVGLAAGALLRTRLPQSKVFLFTLVFTTLSLSQYAYGRASLSDREPENANLPASIPIKSDRNVYLISVESLHSPAAYRRLYGIENPPHLEYLKAEGFRVFDNAYSVDIFTRSSYERILEFSKPLITPRERVQVFRFDNSTFRSFRNSGYAIQFIYVSNHFALNPDLVDHKYPRTRFQICADLPPNFFYVLCGQRMRNRIDRRLFGVEGIVSVRQQVPHLVERIRIAAADTKPWLTISHVALPKHTQKNHRYDNPAQVAGFREQTRAWMPDIADNYRQIVGAIKKHDPDAVIVTFGDHGAVLTRGMASAKPNAVFTTDDYIADRHGVMLGIYPADFCRHRFFEGASTALLAKHVIECLNGNDTLTPADEERSRSVVYVGETKTIDAIKAAP
ncbi:hypothetical protein [Hyphomicrobium sp. CS1GBMeth3]|uniref:hypothetical protein n=1 Tax=Hyphomicrobium sp. CS1GBMeth3 TaxID=1892845 RepID=UPI000931E685|nr:hypothetical protein [Hyphomicrobium sp. CS1GBMeth3]